MSRVKLKLNFLHFLNIISSILLIVHIRTKRNKNSKPKNITNGQPPFL